MTRTLLVVVAGICILVGWNFGEHKSLRRSGHRHRPPPPVICLVGDSLYRTMFENVYIAANPDKKYGRKLPSHYDLFSRVNNLRYYFYQCADAVSASDLLTRAEMLRSCSILFVHCGPWIERLHKKCPAKSLLWSL